MSQRLVGREKKKHQLKQCKQHREKLTALKFNLIGGILNKFYTKWENEKIQLTMKGPSQSDLTIQKTLNEKSFEQKKISQDGSVI